MARGDYSGALAADGGTLTGKQSWRGPDGETRSRACQLAVVPLTGGPRDAQEAPRITRRALFFCGRKICSTAPWRAASDAASAAHPADSPLRRPHGCETFRNGETVKGRSPPAAARVARP